MACAQAARLAAPPCILQLHSSGLPSAHPTLGTKIAQLEGRKWAAVEAEDYDLAKELKTEVDKLRWVHSIVERGASCSVQEGRHWHDKLLGCLTLQECVWPCWCWCWDGKAAPPAMQRNYKISEGFAGCRAAAYSAALAGGEVYDSFKSPMSSRRGSASLSLTRRALCAAVSERAVQLHVATPSMAL